jgi:hypothetical protein
MPESREYVIVPMGWDEGEIEGPDGPMAIQLLDLCDEITVVGAPRDLDPESFRRLSKAFSEHATPGKREFIIVAGPIPVDWQFVKLIPRDQYDPVLRERRPGT